MFTEEQHKKLMGLCQTAQMQLETTTKQLNEAVATINLQSDLLRISNEDIHMLLAFIESKGLQPPKIQSNFIN